MRTLGLLLSSLVLLVLTGCANTQTAACSAALRGGLDDAIRAAEERLASGCTYYFDDYFDQLLDIAVANPHESNKELVSNFLVRQSDRGTISKRQAKEIYNRYFNVKFVSMTGEFNTCSQMCPVRKQVLADMRDELTDKEVGLMKASEDSSAYYRADLLLKEARLVLEATCRACDAGQR